LFNLVEKALKDHDPTVRPASVRAAARLTAVIASQIITQTQAIQRALLTLEEDIPEYGTEFVAQLVREALKDKAKRVGRFTAPPPPALPQRVEYYSRRRGGPLCLAQQKPTGTRVSRDRRLIEGRAQRGLPLKAQKPPEPRYPL